MKVLVSSISREFGGVESLFLNLIQSDPLANITIDFVCTDTSAARENDFQSFGSIIHHIARPSKHLLAYIKQFNELFKTEGYDIYHVNITRYRFPLDVVIAKLNGAKVILHCHATKIYDVGSKRVRIIRQIEQELFRPIFLICSNLNLACSNNAGKYLYGSKKYQILHNGVDVKQFVFDEKARDYIRNELSFSNKKVIGHIGRFSTEKNHTFLLAVLKELLEIDSSYRLLCVGDGDLFEKICEEANIAGLANYVVFTGQRRDIPKLLSAMDIFVFPSIHEALPITLIEAQINGLPCVISDCVTNEIDINDSLYRLPINISPMKWANTILKLNNRRMGVKEIKDFKDFDIGSMGKELKKIYSKMLK